MTLSHHLSLSNCWNHKSAPLQLYTSQSNQPKPRFLNVPHSHVLAGLAYHVDQSKYRVDQKKCDLKKIKIALTHSILKLNSIVIPLNQMSQSGEKHAQD